MRATTDYAIRPYCAYCGNAVYLRVTETESKTTAEIKAYSAPVCKQCTRDKDCFDNILELVREEGRQEERAKHDN